MKLGHEVEAGANIAQVLHDHPGLWICQDEGCARFVAMMAQQLPSRNLVIKGQMGRAIIPPAELLPLLVTNGLDQWAEDNGCGYIREVFVQLAR